MNKVSYRVALGGVVSSLCIFSMFLTGVMPFLYLTLPMIAGALMTIIVVEVNKSWAFLTYAAVSLLSIFVSPNKEAAIIFILLFGYYPIIKDSIEKLRFRLIRVLIKFILFNIIAVIDYQITLYILGVSDMADDFAEKYEGKVEDFVEFISQEDLIAPGTFKQTWRFIEKEKHSLERFTNMHLMFK